MGLFEKMKQLLELPDQEPDILREVFRFERGSYHSGVLSYAIQEGSDGFWFCVKGDLTDRMKEYRFRIPEEDIRRMKEYILPAKDWPADDREEGVLDGYYWILKYDFDGLKVDTSGYMRYPDNYRITTGNLQFFIEYLCVTYAPEEYDYAWEKRIEY